MVRPMNRPMPIKYPDAKAAGFRPRAEMAESGKPSGEAGRDKLGGELGYHGGITRPLGGQRAFAAFSGGPSADDLTISRAGLDALITSPSQKKSDRPGVCSHQGFASPGTQMMLEERLHRAHVFRLEERPLAVSAMLDDDIVACDADIFQRPHVRDGL